MADVQTSAKPPRASRSKHRDIGSRKRGLSLKRTPTFHMDKFLWWKKTGRRQKEAEYDSDSGFAPSTHKFRRSSSLSSLDHIGVGESYGEGGFGGEGVIDDCFYPANERNVLNFQKGDAKDYQLWVQTGKDSAPYPLIGEYKNLFN